MKLPLIHNKCAYCDNEALNQLSICSECQKAMENKFKTFNVDGYELNIYQYEPKNSNTMTQEKFTPEIIAENEYGYKAGIIEITWLRGCGTGWGNGYVCIPNGHPWDGKEYDNIRISIHGGLTFSERISGTWWIGFDSAHSYDTPQIMPREAVIKETMILYKKAIKAGKRQPKANGTITK